MGRITVFSGNDVNSKLVLHELERRQLPYTEISLHAFPDRLGHVQSLCEVPSVPQVFFNTRFVGGVDNTKKELRRWDRSSRYQTPLEKYEAEIASGFDPTNERLALPKGEAQAISHAALSVLSPASIELPDGTMTSFRDITEKLKNSLPTVEVRSNGVLHHHVFTGAATVEVFMSSMGISQEKAIAFGNTLLEAQVIQPLKKKTKKFLKDENVHYRLQCFNQPAVLNSYCLWKGQSPTTNPSKLVIDLIHLLDDIEASAIDTRGQLDYTKARQHHLFPLLEESVCELQKVSPVDLPRSQVEKLSLAMNIYMLMMRYAFFKVGIPLSEPDRLQFLANVQFDLSGTLYSFDEWCDVILGRPQKGKPGLGIKISDVRALWAINTGAMSGSRHSLPFSSFSAVDDAAIEAQLSVAAKVFLGDDCNVSVNRKKGDVKLSNLFLKKRADFPFSADCDLFEAILPYLGGKKKLDIAALVKSKTFKKIKYDEPSLGHHTNNALWFDKETLEVDEKGLRGILKRFRPPKMHKNERARLATLRSLNILDTLEEERYDRITRMVQATFNVPLVFVSLVDQNRQWFKSTVWETNACPRVSGSGRDVSFCGHAIHLKGGQEFIIPNALDDDRFADNPLVTGDLGVRFYAGIPLAVPSEDGNGTVNIGTLCMIDVKPRTLTPEQVETFREHAAMIKKEILRRDLGELGKTSSHSSGTSYASTSSMVSLEEMAGSDWGEDELE